jgi:organic radical activating enzyme
VQYQNALRGFTAEAAIIAAPEGAMIAAAAAWRATDSASRMVVLTSGEPLLEADADLIEALKERGCDIAVKTNGAQPLLATVDWLCVSPKAGAPLVFGHADELKLVYPQMGAMPEMFAEFPAKYQWLSPMDGQDRQRNTESAAAYCLARPRWRLAVQAHTSWGLP